MGPFGRHLLGDLERLGVVVLGGDDAADQTVVQRLGRREEAPGQDHVHRQRLADGAGEPLGAAGAGHDADVDLRLPDLRGLGCDDDVALHHQLAAAAEGEAADGRYDRLLDHA